MSNADDAVNRRRFLALGGMTVLVAACSSSSDDAITSTSGAEATAPASTTSPAPAAATATTTTLAGTTAPTPPSPIAALAAADFDGVGTCTLLPESTAGPFPLAEQFVRRDITEGNPGHPLRLGLRVIDAACAPVPGAAVEIWHTDATGDYSAFVDRGGGKDEGPGTTFMRGTQMAGDDGIVEFQTIYPGWYRGRTVHIHLRVRTDDELVLTSQLYFDDAYTADVLAEEPYAEFGPPDTSNAQDFLAGDPAAEGTLIALHRADTPSGPGTLGLLNLVVNP